MPFDGPGCGAAGTVASAWRWPDRCAATGLAPRVRAVG